MWDGVIEWVGSFLLSRAVAVRPVVTFQNHLMLVRSDWRTRMWSFGAWSRLVMVDRNLEEVRIRQRTFWLFVKRRIVRFQDVAEVMYGYVDANPASFFSFAYQSDDVYTVGLKLTSGEIVKLFRYFGEGDFVNQGFFPDWWYLGDQLHAMVTKVDQSSASLTLADLLSRTMNVPIGNPPL